MYCWFCGSTMNWNSDYNYDEIYGEGDGVVAMLTCMNPDCGAEAEFSLRTDNEEEEE